MYKPLFATEHATQIVSPVLHICGPDSDYMPGVYLLEQNMKSQVEKYWAQSYDRLLIKDVAR